MTYLYGDSTPSQLTSNFLEFLRDAVDFAVVLLQADKRITEGRSRAATLTEEAETDAQRLEAFTKIVRNTIETTEQGDPDSATSHFASRLIAVVADTHRSAAHGVRQRLADQIAGIDADESAAREGCVRALETLLIPHDPPDASSVKHVVLSDDGTRYQARLTGKAAFGLDWLVELGIPDSSLWASPVSLARLSPQLEINIPQLTGWISKEVKIKPLRVEKWLVTKLVDDGRALHLELREPGAATGLDLDIVFASHPHGREGQPEQGTMQAIRVAPADDPTSGVFELTGADAAAILEIAGKLRAAAEFPRKALLAANSGGHEFRAQPSFVDAAERLIGMMAPITREISDRSLTPDELIMRKPLGNDRREEFFLSKALVRSKYAVLDELYRAFFEPLGLERASPEGRSGTTASAMPPVARIEHTPMPTEPSQPPPPGEPRSVPPPLPPPSVPPMTGGTTQRMGPLPPARMPPRRENTDPFPAPSPAPALPGHKFPVPAAVPPPVISTPGPSAENINTADIVVVEQDDDEPEVEVETPFPPITRSGPPPEVRTPEPNPVSFPPPAASVPPPAASVPPVAPSIPPGLMSASGKPSELVSALKQILGLTRTGRFQDAYRQFAALFTDFAFSGYGPEEQRQALRLMLIPKMRPPRSEVVLDAHRAAVFRLKNLTEAFNDAGDYELLGIAYLGLDDQDAARTAFTTGLGIERERDPSSNLVGALMKRVSEL